MKKLDSNGITHVIMFVFVIVIALTGTYLLVKSHADQVPIDKNNITADSLQTSINQAAAALNKNPNTDQRITIPAGRYDLTSKIDRGGTLNLNSVHPNGTGRLIISGAGRSGTNATTLVFDKETTQFFGNNTKHVTIQNMVLTTKQFLTSQGTVVSATPTDVVIQVDPGYPSPNDIAEYLSCQNDSELSDCYGMWLRQFNGDRTNPEIVTAASNVQVSWSCPLANGTRTCERVPASDNKKTGALAYRLLTNVLDQRWVPSRDAPVYKPGDAIAIKSKSAGQAYTFMNSDDIIFKNITWMQKARGVFRLGTKNVQILNSSVVRDHAIQGRTPLLATSDGGPQIGQPKDPQTSGNVVDGYSADATGDDALAFFNAIDSKAANVQVEDSFGRGILLRNSKTVTLENNNLVRSRLVYKD